MNINISEYPSSYLVVELNKSEKIITEKGAMIFCDNEYGQENKIEIRNYKNWIAKLSGKSFSYNIYTAKDNSKFVFSPKNNAEIFQINICDESPIIFEPSLHFARTIGLEIKLVKKDWKSTLNDGLKLRTYGNGVLILKGYGQIVKHEINSEKAIYVDENALIAFEEKLQIKTITKGVKDLLTSGEGFLYEIKGQGTIWLQTREKGKESSGGGIIDGLFSFFK